ncbi:MAG: calcium/sodium antiporter [Candidatus Woesearchaeota archaeon]
MVLDIIIPILIFLVSLYVLTKGADFLVNGATDLARYLKVSPIMIGLTLVSFGTSLPEFVVSFFAVLTGNVDISIGNIIGSNIANIGLVLGLSALIFPLAIKSESLMYEFPFMIVSTFLFMLLANNLYLFNGASYSIGRIDALIFLTVLLIFIVYVYKSIKDHRKAVLKEFKDEYKHINPLWKNTAYITAGISMLFIGGKVFVGAASDLARGFGISEAFIGVTIVAIGTSLPELFTSVVAAWKKETSIAIGNLVGSNIFNILFVLGIVGLVKPIVVNPGLLFFDGMIMVGITLLFLLFATMDMKVKRYEGAILMLCYLTYIGFLIWRL